MHKEKTDFPICQNGFQCKTINIRTTAGGLKFNLQQVNELGLPREAMILGIWVRQHDNTITASNGLTLVDGAIFENSYLTLKDRSSSSGQIDLVYSEYHFPELLTATFTQPIISANIDWNQSFIQINPRATANDNQVFEMVIIYSDACSEMEFPNRFKFRFGQDYAGCRISTFEVALNTVQTQYPLSNTDNIGLPQNALILGFSTANNETPLFGEVGMNDQSRNSSYITFKQGTCSFVDQYPVSLEDYNAFLIPGLNYFPIIPTQTIAIDWQQSKLEVLDNTGIVNGMVFQFSLWWYSTEC